MVTERPGGDRRAPERAAAEPAARNSRAYDPHAQIRALQRSVARAEQRLAEHEHRVQVLTGHASFRLASWLRRTQAWNLLRWLKTGNRGVVTVQALGVQGLHGDGGEVWVLEARPAPRGHAVPWESFELVDPDRWTRERRPQGPYGQALRTTGGTLRLPLHGDDPVLTFLRGPRGGRVAVEYDRLRCVIDLVADEECPVSVHLRKLAHDPAPASAGSGPTSISSRRARTADQRDTAGGRFTDGESRWIEEMRNRSVPVLAIHTPRWVGVSSSTRTLFEHCYPFPASPEVEPYAIGPVEARRQAALIAESGVRHVVCSGGDEIHLQLVRELKHLDDDIRCDFLWHGSPMQFGEDYTWRVIRQWIDAGREGVVHTIGTVKQGMEEVFQGLGCRSRFVMNYVPEVPSGPSVPDPGGPYLGLWLSGPSPWKLPYPMLAAARLVPGGTIRTANLGPRAAEVADFLELPSDQRVERILPPDDLREAIRRTHLTLYVTFSECCPMLPLESLSVGTPCLTGPTSHLFEDEEYLHARLVVPYPDRADIIARYIRRALDDRADIVTRYMQYAPSYNARARESIRRFLQD